MTLPGQTGNDFLDWLRKEPRFADLPFVFLSGSFLPMDRTRADELGAGGFFVKTGDIQQMVERVESMLKHLPREPRGRDS